MILDSEQSDECINFTMLCVYVCLCTRERVKIMFQFQTLVVVSDSKINLDGALGRSFLKFPIVFKSAGKKQKKIKENGNFYTKPIFD
ncbi:Uncharacterized protein FWK35_00028169 [Aphis craccivora]|uniref:Uncharacterized protein n=1 Tax=Aphis craccivora TaxID=307492 RepID=A0A6G0YX04_APHCR|nr:Uncharacterized protein FWK35_00028169 [Aphis craccivora]